MQRLNDHRLSCEDRAVISSSIFSIFAFCVALVFISGILSFLSPRSQPDEPIQIAGSISNNVIDPFAQGMPLP
ncbi:hypothetical protein [Bradyrhizobium genosp. A]|uniref:hypothetical protein n=1 Tax=Bradyrhizobium genosp. A TaxID=83626 RepID=UPI003CEB0E08